LCFFFAKLFIPAFEKEEFSGIQVVEIVVFNTEALLR
jgi:hypothetical protein